MCRFTIGLRSTALSALTGIANRYPDQVPFFQVSIRDIYAEAIAEWPLIRLLKQCDLSRSICPNGRISISHWICELRALPITDPSPCDPNVSAIIYAVTADVELNHQCTSFANDDLFWRNQLCIADMFAVYYHSDLLSLTRLFLCRAVSLQPCRSDE